MLPGNLNRFYFGWEADFCHAKAETLSVTIIQFEGSLKNVQFCHVTLVKKFKLIYPDQCDVAYTSVTHGRRKLRRLGPVS